MTLRDMFKGCTQPSINIDVYIQGGAYKQVKVKVKVRSVIEQYEYDKYIVLSWNFDKPKNLFIVSVKEIKL